MGRPNRSAERRQELIRPIAETFAASGYRRTTTAALAERCGLPEQALYRLWPDKGAMFVAAIEFVGEFSLQVWQQMAGDGAADAAGRTGAERVLAHEARHLGDLGLYRILFAAFAEVDDERILSAMRRVYQRLLQEIARQIEAHRATRGGGDAGRAELVAWALIGLGTATNLGREFGLLGDRKRRELFEGIGRHLLG